MNRRKQSKYQSLRSKPRQMIHSPAVSFILTWGILVACMVSCEEDQGDTKQEYDTSLIIQQTRTVSDEYLLQTSAENINTDILYLFELVKTYGPGIIEFSQTNEPPLICDAEIDFEDYMIMTENNHREIIYKITINYTGHSCENKTRKGEAHLSFQPEKIISEMFKLDIEFNDIKITDTLNSISFSGNCRISPTSSGTFYKIKSEISFDINKEHHGIWKCNYLREESNGQVIIQGDTTIGENKMIVSKGIDRSGNAYLVQSTTPIKYQDCSGKEIPVQGNVNILGLPNEIEVNYGLDNKENNIGNCNALGYIIKYKNNNSENEFFIEY